MLSNLDVKSLISCEVASDNHGFFFAENWALKAE